MALKRINIILLSVGAILLIPFIAMQFTTEVNWGLLDFVVAGGLLLVAGLSVNGVLQSKKTVKARALLVTCIIVVLLLVWAELAVGLFDTPFAGD